MKAVVALAVLALVAYVAVADDPTEKLPGVSDLSKSALPGQLISRF
jgi:hypothetical protein